MNNRIPFKRSAAYSLGVELELQLISRRDYDLTRAASSLVSQLPDKCDNGEIKLEITESMIEINTHPQTTVNGIKDDLLALRNILKTVADSNNVGICGGGTHAFHDWKQRKICPGERFEKVSQRYGYLAKQFTVFGQHIHVGCASADDAIWLTQNLAPFVPYFIALSASSPFIEGADTSFQSARLNAVSAFPLSGQCPVLQDWAAFEQYIAHMQNCGVVDSIKDLYWDVRPKPEFGTVEIRICDTPLDLDLAIALTAFAQNLCAYLIEERSSGFTEEYQHVARFNKFQACRFGMKAELADAPRKRPFMLRAGLTHLLTSLIDRNRFPDTTPLLETLRLNASGDTLSHADWLREQFKTPASINDVVWRACERFMEG